MDKYKCPKCDHELTVSCYVDEDEEQTKHTIVVFECENPDDCSYCDEVVFLGNLVQDDELIWSAAIILKIIEDFNDPV